MLFFEGLYLPHLGFQVRVNFPLVGMVVGESRMNLRQQQVAKLPHDFFRNQPHVVPLSDPSNRNTRPCDARPAAANLGTSSDQAACLGNGRHRLQA